MSIAIREDVSRNWWADVLEIRDLFKSCQFKRCATRCEALWSPHQHPICSTFLYFYRALCYESLSASMHQRASNKTDLLQFARAHLALALKSLLQYAEYVEFEFDFVSECLTTESPICPTFDILHQYATPQSTLHITEKKNARSCQVQGIVACDAHQLEANDGNLSPPHINPAHREHNTSGPTTSQPTNTDANELPNLEINHKAKLSQSLSSNHVLADELVPSPLFRKSQTRLTDRSQESRNTQTSSQPRLSPSQLQRPLPVLPFFNRSPKFKKQGNRYVLVPRTPRDRQTAIQTLIAKFEGRLSSTSPRTPITPVTPRFRRISQVFGGGWTPTPIVKSPSIQSLTVVELETKDSGNGEVRKIKSGRNSELNGPTPTPSCSPQQIATPVNPTAVSPHPNTVGETSHEAALRSFHTSLLRHIAKLDATIAETAHAQRQRDSEAMDVFQNTPTRHRTARSETAESLTEKSDMSPVRASRLFRRGHDAGAGVENVRLRRLRGCGFVVRKERHGWKGQGWYDRLRREVEEELEREGR